MLNQLARLFGVATAEAPPAPAPSEPVRERPKLNIRGFIEAIDATQVAGWAIDQDDPSAHLRVEIRLGDAVLGSCVADHFREDLQKAGIGAGDHAFPAPLARPVRENETATLEARAVDAHGRSAIIPLLKRKFAPEAVPPEAGPADPPAPTILASDICDPTQEPLFILGAARSGTSALTLALLKTGYYQGFGEGHLFSLLPELQARTREHFVAYRSAAKTGTLLDHIDESMLDRALRRMFIDVVRATFTIPRWLDKTPKVEMVAAAPLLHELWPKARFVFMKRRGIENVASRLAKFPSVPFEEHCQDWAQVMRCWRSVRGRLGNAAIEVEQLDLATDPANILAKMQPFLGLPCHVVEAAEKNLTSDKPEKTSVNFAALSCLDEIKWTSGVKAVFIHICGHEMSSFGYTTGRDLRYEVEESSK